jgi:hypothetical protein
MLDLDQAIMDRYSARMFLHVQLPRCCELMEDRANA